MATLPDGFYARCRAQNISELLLRERDGAFPPERVLQSVWHHQRLQRDQLRTVDGRAVRVLHPGFWNHEAGPDFRGAVIQIGREETRSGDIEIDLTRRNWHGHHHDCNPAFANVILHVIWQAERTGAEGHPTLALAPYLDTPLNEMRGWAEGPAAANWPDNLRGACSVSLGQLEPEQSDALLKQAALIRFQRKGVEMEIRARQAGWEQALWEGLFRALGYKQNIWPMQRLAELLPQLPGTDDTALAWQARLLGVSGFLDAAHERSGHHAYLQTLWDHWWREREKFQELILPKTLWRMNGLRPANQPQRRLALAAHWVAWDNFPARLEEWFVSAPAGAASPQSLLTCLQPAADDFWSWHWSFHSARLGRAQPMLGESRATDLAVNVILPWFWIRARTGKNEPLSRRAEDLFLHWPAAQDNSLLRLARQRMWGQKTVPWRRSAASQQGLLQIVRDFCDRSNAVCAECRFPDMVRQIG